MSKRIPKLLRSLCAAVCVLLVVPALLAGCGSSEEAVVDSQTYLYYRDADGLGTSRVAFVPKGESKAQLASSYLTALNQAPAGSTLVPLLPENVELNSSLIKGSVLTLDFSGSYHTMDKKTEVLTRAGYVRTLTQVPGIDYVIFTVDGVPLTLDGEIQIGPMNADTFIENAGKSVNSYLHHNITLYFADETGSYLVPEGRSIYYNSNKPLEWAIVERLIAGPKAEGSFRSIAAETQIISVATQDRTCYVNLSESFNTSRLPVSDEVAVYSIVDSLIRNCDLDNVQISIGGNTNVTFGSSIELSSVFQMNKNLIREARS